ncbi:MAG: DUF6268 family outer membrane beta-barrel protein [Bacteroidota bacterium]
MRKAITLVIFTISISGKAQNMMLMGGSDEFVPLAINYTAIPDLGGTTVTNYGTDLTLGFPVKKSMMAFSLGYQNFDFTFEETTNVIDLSAFENMQVFRGGISYIKPLSNNWRLMLSGGAAIMSNLEGDLNSEDFVFNAIVGALKKWGNEERNTTLLIGAFYGTQFGEPTLLPAFSLRQKLNDHWSYSIGLPITGLNYRINDRHRFALQLTPQGIFGNNSQEERVTGNRTLSNTKLQFNGITTRLSYQYRFTKYIALFTEGGFIPQATLKILDSDNEEILDLDPGNGVFFNVGLRMILPRRNTTIPKKESNEN